MKRIVVAAFLLTACQNEPDPSLSASSGATSSVELAQCFQIDGGTEPVAATLMRESTDGSFPVLRAAVTFPPNADYPSGLTQSLRHCYGSQFGTLAERLQGVTCYDASLWSTFQSQFRIKQDGAIIHATLTTGETADPDMAEVIHFDCFGGESAKKSAIVRVD